MEETPELDRFYRENKDKVGFLVIAVKDAEQDVRSFMQAGGYDLPVLLDPDASIAGRYRVTGVPTSVAITPEGALGQTKIGSTSASDLEDLLGVMQ